MQDLQTTPFAIHDDTDPARVVRGELTRPTSRAEPLPAVILVHGLKGFLRWGFFPELARRIADRGMAAVAINLSGGGVGEDLESFTEDEAFFRTTASRDVEDVLRVRSFLETNAATHGIDPGRLALFGHSRGGGTVLLCAERAGDFSATVTWASVSTTDRASEEAKRAWRESGAIEIPNARTGQIHRVSTDWLDDFEANQAALDIQAACSRLRVPTLLVHGTEDEAVPCSEALALESAFEPGVAELLTIEGAGHTFGAVHPFAGTTDALERATGATLDFLASRLLRDEP